MTNLMIRTFALTMAFLPLVFLPVSAAESDTDQPSRILVTFNGAVFLKAANKPAPVKSYRYRSRYNVPQALLQDARDVATEYDLKLVDDWPIESLNVYCVVYELTLTESIPLLLQKLGQDARLESAQKMNSFESLSLPKDEYNDSYAGYQHSLESMSVSQAHKFANGHGVKIAVIDSGVDLRHEDLRVSNIQSRDFVSTDIESSSNAHGTAVVSVIVATPNNAIGIVGIAPSAQVIALRACWTSDETEIARCDSLTLAKALDYLVRSPPDLINLSIAGPRDPLLGRLIDKALQNGTIVVAAQLDQATSEKEYPAGHEGVLAIRAASSTIDSARLNASTDAILAPGEQIMVALPGNGYDFRSGSSLAAANASGVIALLLEQVPELDSERVADILRSSQVDNEKGINVINACRALAALDTADTCM